MGKIKKPSKNTKINTVALDVRVEKSTVLLSFKNVCDRHYQLSEWRKEELKDLIKTFKTIEELTWNEMPHHLGLNYKTNIEFISSLLPQDFLPEANLSEMRVNRESRLLGYRTGNIFNIIWFDRGHKACSKGKRKRA